MVSCMAIVKPVAGNDLAKRSPLDLVRIRGDAVPVIAADSLIEADHTRGYAVPVTSDDEDFVLLPGNTASNNSGGNLVIGTELAANEVVIVEETVSAETYDLPKELVLIRGDAVNATSDAVKEIARTRGDHVPVEQPSSAPVKEIARTRGEHVPVDN